MRKQFHGILSSLVLLGLLFFAFHVKPAEAYSLQSSASTNAKVKDSDIASLPPIDWTHYHNYTEIVTILLALNETYPEIVDVFSIGKSTWNRDIYCIRLSNETNQSPKPQVFFVGYHHAREPITAELTLYFAVWTATNYGIDETITQLVKKSEIYVVVALNVDGFDLFQANDYQRKNARPTNEDGDALVDEDPPEDEDGDGFIEQLIDYSDPEHPTLIRWEGTDNDADGHYAEDWVGGVDLNRNYNYSWVGGSTNPRCEIYKGPAPFSEPETQAVRDFVLQHDFMYAISFHSGAELVLYPWGYTCDPAPDEAEFIDIAQKLSFVSGGTTYEQSSDLYISHGLWDDWLYGIAGVYALTCEIFTNDTWEGVSHLGPYPNTVWEGGLKYWFNPFPQNIESVVLRWLPVFFCVVSRAIGWAFHDVSVKTIDIDKSVVGEGFTVEVNVTVQNIGAFDEVLNMTIYANASVALTKAVEPIKPGLTIVNLRWNTTGFAKGNYTISVYASRVLNETDIDDNSLTDGWVIVAMVGDVTGPDGWPDGKVDMIHDIRSVAKLFGVAYPDPRYNPNYDINDNGIIDMIADIRTVAKHFGDIDP